MGKAMRAMQALVVVMGVLILAGVIVVVVTIVGRASPGTRLAGQAILDEPPGTHIASAAIAGRQVVVVLQGGGPDRVMIVDLDTGRKTAGLSLAR